MIVTIKYSELHDRQYDIIRCWYNTNLVSSTTNGNLNNVRHVSYHNISDYLHFNASVEYLI